MNEGFSVPSLVPNQTSLALSGEQNFNPSGRADLPLIKCHFLFLTKKKQMIFQDTVFEEKGVKWALDVKGLAFFFPQHGEMLPISEQTKAKQLQSYSFIIRRLSVRT